MQLLQLGFARRQNYRGLKCTKIHEAKIAQVIFLHKSKKYTEKRENKDSVSKNKK